MRDAGQLGEDQVVATGRGERAFAAGDRVMFLRNERSMGVKNGSLGQVEAVTPGRMAVRLDDGRQVAFDLKDYVDIDHGYAATIHKAQGVTVDRAHVLASSGLDRHAAYVALTRHRDGMELHYGADQFADHAALARTLGRERAKDTTLDYRGQSYREAFAERRGIHVPAKLQQAAPARGEVEGSPKPGRFAGLKLGPARAVEPVVEPAPGRGRFEGLRLWTGPLAEPPALGTPVLPEMCRDGAGYLDRAVERFGRAYGDAARMGPQGFAVLEHQKAELREAGRVG